MSKTKETVIKMQRARHRLEEIQAGRCTSEFEAKAAAIYPRELQQADKERINAKCRALFEITGG